MIVWLKKIYYSLQVKFLITFNHTLLFNKINQLNWYKDMLNSWVDNQCFTPKSTVLEVGCSTGTLTNYMTTLGYKPHGVDYSNKMIKQARTNYSQIDFSVASVLDLPFDNDVYDAVIAASLINIVSDKRAALKELFRTCKTGGVVTILVPAATFHDENLISLHDSLGNTGFSFAAMEAWHNLAPKMETDDITNLFKTVGLINITTKMYLQGMVVSVSGTKPL